jgi:hypothetical protein
MAMINVRRKRRVTEQRIDAVCALQDTIGGNPAAPAPRPERMKKRLAVSRLWGADKNEIA